MTYPELQINLDLLDKEDKWDFITSNLPSIFNDNRLFAVCEEGDCHLFDEDGNECNIDEVKEINGFANKEKLAAIKIPDCVTSIEPYAFFDCKGLISVMIPASVTNIGNYAFYSCNSLTSVTIQNSVINIGNGAFFKCSGLTSVTIPNSVTNIGVFAFANCSGLTSMTIPDSVTSIWSDAFCRCKNLKSLSFKGKTIDQVKKMQRYPWGIEDESIIKCI